MLQTSQVIRSQTLRNCNLSLGAIYPGDKNVGHHLKLAIAPSIRTELNYIVEVQCIHSSNTHILPSLAKIIIIIIPQAS